MSGPVSAIPDSADPAGAASEPPAPPGPPAAPGLGDLKKKALRGSILEMAGYGASQLLRLASNLVLSRLLFPEAFGLVALVGTFNVGLVLLSDVGIQPAVVQNERGDDLTFLNTAWTIQVIRGFILYSIAVLCAWPLSKFYGEPQLFGLNVVGSLAVLVNSWHSTSLYTLRRRLSVGRLNLIELGAQLCSLVVTVTWSLLHASVWPLVAGSIAGPLFRVVASHRLDVGYKNRFAWDPASRTAIANFGKWIMAASAVFFVSWQSDRLLLGKFLGVKELGIYSIALMLSEAMSSLITRVTYGVLHPVFSRVQREARERLSSVYYRVRLMLDAVSLPAIGVMIMLGPFVVRLLYDARYREAGWMLQVFCVRVAMNCIQTPCETCLFSIGQTRYGLYQNIARAIWILVGMPAGWLIGGLHGLVWAVALSEIPIFFVSWPALHRAGVLRLRREAFAFVFLVAGIGVGWIIRRLFHI